MSAERYLLCCTTVVETQGPEAMPQLTLLTSNEKENDTTCAGAMTVVATLS
jgi:hypothetical protein